MMTAAALLDQARARLAGEAQEALGRRRSGRWRGERIVRAGAAWHVGGLLITPDEVLAVGQVIRAAQLVRRGYASEAQRSRAALSGQAHRGGFAEGEVVHIDWTVIDVAAVDAGGASGPLALVDGAPRMRWRAGGGYAPLDAYLSDQLALRADRADQQ